MNNVLILTYWAYDDALIQTYTLPYLKQIKDQIGDDSRITLVTYEPDPARLFELENETFRDFDLFPLPYSPFGGKAMFSTIGKVRKLKKITKQKNIHTIHCWCTPAGAIGYMLHRLTGLPLVLDSFEPHAESMVENGTWTREGKAFKILFKLERKQAEKASHIIGLTKGMKSYCEEKYAVSPKSYFIKPACVDLEKFDSNQYENIRSELGLSETDIVCIYAGKVGGIYLEDEIFQFWKQCDELIPNFKVIFLSNLSDEHLQNYCQKHQLDPSIIIKKFVPHADVPKYMAQANFALNPVKPVPSKRYCTSIKDGEYWAMGLPVAITANISDDSEIISENKTGVVLESFDADHLKRKITELVELMKDENLKQRVRQQAIDHRNFENSVKIYRKIYSS